MWLSLGLGLILIVFALLEILTTGFLYDKFGVVKLSLIYLVTTILGIFFLSIISKIFIRVNERINKISKTASFKEMISSWKDNKISGETPEEKIILMLTSLQVLYTFGWICILLPGLITDVISYFCILIFWIVSMKLKKPLTSQKNTPSAPTSQDSAHF